MDSSTALHIVSGALGVIALVGLWKTTRGDRVVSAIVAAGLLARAGIGLALFAISLRQLPVATSLQLGDGYWSFAQD